MSLTRSLQTYVLALGFAAALPPGLAAAAAVQGVVIDPDGRVTPGSAQELAAHTAALAGHVHQGQVLSDQGSIRGTVVDPLGARVQATVTLLRDGQRVTESSSNARGDFAFDALPGGRYQIEVQAAGFEPGISDPVFVGSSAEVVIEIALQIGPLEQYVVITAAATDLPQSRVGSPVTVIDHDMLVNLAKPDLLEALRTVPGMHVVQAGQRGGRADIFVRGGGSNFNKVLLDGVPANDIGGAFNFGNLAMTAIDRVEVLRSSNSVLYGSDALSGVINITTRRGRSHRPELTYSIDTGNLGTTRQELAVGGVVERFDYFLDVSRFDTDNDLPNNVFRNDTFAGRFGFALGSATDLSVTVRRADTDLGLPGAFLYNGIADDSSQSNTLTTVGVTAQSQLTDRWRSTLRFVSIELSSHFVNPSPTGEPFDPFGFGPNFLGDPVTITGANGFAASGRAILDFGGTYPSVFDSNTTRRLFSGQADYRVQDALDVSAGVRIENEDGVSGSSSSSERTNVGSFVEARGSLGQRLHVNGGLGFEHNEIFGYATTPRLSVAAYLRTPSASSTTGFGDTKLTFNVGKGIKAPAVFDEQNSLFALLQAAPGGDALIQRFGVEPIGPERSRSLDIGIEQGLWDGRARVRAAFFHNEFRDLIEFVSNTVLPGLGIPPEVAAAVFGARVNSSSYRARGLETSAEVAFGRLVRVSGSYTYLDAVVTESLSGGALAPATNPAFPGINIGQFSPLVGARPFRRPAHSGSLLVTYTAGPAQVSLAGYFVGKSDDSTFLSDGFFGSSLLLPNHNLDDSYQKLDLSGSYRLQPRLRWYASIENLLDQEYAAVAGFPALPRTVRTGLTVRLGGDSTTTP